MKIFRHQPLLIWTLLLLLLAGTAVVGATSGRERPLRTAPSAETSGDYEQLLAQSAALMAAVGADDLPSWAATSGPIISDGLKASSNTNLNPAWSDVDARFRELLAAGETGDKTRILSAVSAYNNAVGALVRLARQ